ncbi:MAG: ParB/RepB/Spo0J family partition protein [Oribacterium parvum]|jgi:stage 0 DNA-binding protein|uniref:ParB-like partition protein n=3 Tax=Oribacterium parvum TaxID=1501329 RepID=G9WL38_9FIRM|nr:ParB/RepB/Spo0J family partition protein [Oribacterium parvum]EHL13282.1 ParB-like partition protein [Oribacterium parvum ACB1]EJF13860.1 ParB-like protein [Oribacterium parvum ACB8]MBF1283383.1 ParB/RepB/Spo0J family partition protein [Oribacterium parvum]
MAKHGLGRGVDSLFAANPGKIEKKEGGEEAKLLKISLIQANPSQPRKRFSDEELKELSESIKQFGVIQPLLVKKQGPIYEIIAGERRFRAAKLAGLTEVPVLVRSYDEKLSREVSIIENIQREDLNAVEEALAYQSLISEYDLSQEELAERLSKKRTTITNSLRLLKLEEEILNYIREGKLKEGHGRALLAIPEGKKRLALARECVEKKLSVREVEKRSQEQTVQKKKKKPLSGQLSSIFKDLEEKMRENLGTKVKIIPKNENKGKLEIEYYSQEDLERIYVLLEGKAKG